ncbi:hypothetical protein O6H91_11G043700 [Diphasiastrum complanatum]|uniref:Uncharacterized protein n=1 Tax=Diphasiastrum complanatum TaxID=34168 RepID=A0ACC2C8Y7_DIPCM|nr:hypothetical protein O6H91_11G043700 [Diphasiastrum complanatum]
MIFIPAFPYNSAWLVSLRDFPVLMKILQTVVLLLLLWISVLFVNWVSWMEIRVALQKLVPQSQTSNHNRNPKPESFKVPQWRLKWHLGKREHFFGKGTDQCYRI